MAATTYLTGLFAGRDSVQRACQAALDRGYAPDELDVVMSDETRVRQFEVDDERREPEGSGSGAALAEQGLGIAIASPGAAALSDWNIPEECIRRYQKGVAQGGVLVALRPRSEDDAVQLERLWRSADGVDLCR